MSATGSLSAGPLRGRALLGAQVTNWGGKRTQYISRGSIPSFALLFKRKLSFKRGYEPMMERRIMMDARRIGRQIKHFRELAGLSKSELARRVGVSPTAVHNWEENGVMPRIDVSHRLTGALEVSFVQLMNGNDSPEPHAATDAPSTHQPEVSRGERLDQYRRQIAALFDVPADRVEVVVRT